MKLLLLRHGLAVEREKTEHYEDSERPLTAKGKRKLGRIAEAMAAMDLQIGAILSSPYLRARQTAEIVAETLGLQKNLQLTDTLAPGGSPQELVQLVNRIKPAPESILFVGHEPYLSELISLLVSGEPSLSVVMKKGGLCQLSAESFRPTRCACLDWLLTPKQMRLMA